VKIIVGLVLLLSGIRLLPHILVMMVCARRHVIGKDLDRWGRVMQGRPAGRLGRRVVLFVRLMTFNPEFRNLFYHRVGLAGRILALLCREMPTLYIYTREVGPGLFIQHGFSTVIAAAKIGENCWVNQQVTIGFSNPSDRPTIGNNVQISAGAKVIGKVSIGDNSKVGANAVVVKDVPPNTTVVGVPAYIIRQNGIKVRLPL
jgi:serine O-acetyltransferase